MSKKLVFLVVVFSKSILFAGAFENSICDVISSSVSSQWCLIKDPLPEFPRSLEKRKREAHEAWPDLVFAPAPPIKKVKTGNIELEEHLRKVVIRREVLSSVPIIIDEEKYRAFCNSFPFPLTSCQEQAIQEIARDFQGLKPMNRALIGSLGFGKTEVALRTAFLMACSGKQVVLVAPSKELAKQHFALFDKRFLTTNLKVVFVPAGRKKKELLESIEQGFAKVIIGTSAVLSKDIVYKDVACIIYDEEHKFGVEQKERLHQLFINAHILWMTATPIPRTLAIINEGLIVASYLRTPPEGRFAIISEQIKFNEIDLQRTIDFELAREGQVFVVSPKIKDMEMIERMLRKLYPDQSIISAHGEMPQSDIEEALRDFRNAKTKILIATTIIENGIDIPNANTMIMVHPTPFGISTLSQLRGRIGRTNKQAYCYIAIDHNKPKISSSARKRFKEFLQNSHLGSDIDLAVGDLYRRGGGSILCAKQTGKRPKNLQTLRELKSLPPESRSEEEFSGQEELSANFTKQAL